MHRKSLMELHDLKILPHKKYLAGMQIVKENLFLFIYMASA